MGSPQPSNKSHFNTLPEMNKLEEVIYTEREDFVKRVSTITSLAALVVAIFSAFLGLPILNVFLILTLLLFWIGRSENTLTQKSILLICSYYVVAVIDLFFFGLQGPAAIYLILVGVLAITLFNTRIGTIIISFCLVTWLIAGSIYSFLGATPYLVNEVNPIVTWLASAANMFLVILALIQSRLSNYEILSYAVTLSNEKRDLQTIRSELLIKQKSLDYEQHLLHVLMDNVSDRIFFKDIYGHYTRVSKALARQFGVSPQEVIGKTDADFFSAEYAQQIKETEEDLLNTNQAIIDKVERETWRDGRPDTWSITNRMLLRDPEGRILGWFGTSRNITEIKKAQQTAQHYAHQLATISEVARAVTSTIILNDLLDILVTLLCRSFNYYAVNVWLKNELGDALKLEISSMNEVNLNQKDFAIELDRSSRSRPRRECSA